MNGHNYTYLLSYAREAVVQKRPVKLARGVMFLQDNATDHIARIARHALEANGLPEIGYPPYHLDLAPSDFFPIFKFKKGVTRTKFLRRQQDGSDCINHFEQKSKAYCFQWYESIVFTM